MSEIEIHRINSIIGDITLVRLECDWINDQTYQSFRSIIEKGTQNFLYLELLWSIGQELSPYFDGIKSISNEKNEASVKESFSQILKESKYSGSIEDVFSTESDDRVIASRLTMLEHVFFYLQSIQLELFNKEFSTLDESSSSSTTTATTSPMDTKLDQSNDVIMTDEFQNILINKIQTLCEIFQIRFNNLDSFISVLNAIQNKIEQVLKTLPKDFISEPFFKNTVFSDQEKQKIQEMSELLYNDYNRRSEVLCKRLDVTVQSLLWSDRVQSQLDEINWHIRYHRDMFPFIHRYTFQDLICTHRDILDIIKTSVHSKSVKLTRQVIVGAVPDRGGRTTDRKSAMPSFHKRVEYSQDNFFHRKKSKK